MANKIINETAMPFPDISSSEAKEIKAEINIVTRKMVTIQRMALFLSFFDEAGSALDTTISPLCFLIMTVTSRINLTA